MRYSRKELCRRYKLSRNRLYGQRTKVVSELKAVGLSQKKKDSLDRKWGSLNKRIDDLSSKIFKCGKRYEKLKEARRSLVRKKARLMRELRDRDLSDKEKVRIWHDVNESEEKLRDVEELMGKKIIVRQGKIQIISDVKTGIAEEILTVWDLKKRVSQILSGGEIKIMEVEGVSFDLDKHKMEGLWALDDFISDVISTARKRGFKTPMVKVILDIPNNSIVIFRI